MPFEAGWLATPGDASAVFVVENLAYVADWRSGVRIIDVSDPANPRETGSFSTRQRCNDIEVLDTFAFVTDDDSGLSIYSIADVANPYYVGGLIVGDGIHNLSVKGDYVYLAGGDLYIIDVANPASPFEAGRYRTFDEAWDVDISGFNALVAYQGNQNVLRVIDVSNPSSPRLLGLTLLPDWPWGVSEFGNYCYVTCLDSGLRVYDISNPQQPEEAGFYVSASWALGAFADNSFVYLANDYTGLSIIENTLITGVTEQPGRPRSRIVLSPNPAHGRVTVILPGHTTGAKVSLYDASGSLVREQPLLTDRAEMPLRGIRPGVYLVRAGGMTEKLIVAH